MAEKIEEPATTKDHPTPISSLICIFRTPKHAKRDPNDSI